MVDEDRAKDRTTSYVEREVAARGLQPADLLTRPAPGRSGSCPSPAAGRSPRSPCASRSVPGVGRFRPAQQVEGERKASTSLRRQRRTSKRAARTQPWPCTSAVRDRSPTAFRAATERLHHQPCFLFRTTPKSGNFAIPPTKTPTTRQTRGAAAFGACCARMFQNAKGGIQ